MELETFNTWINPPPRPVEFDPPDEIDPAWRIPLALFNPDKVQGECGPKTGLDCPDSQGCINDGFCNREYDEYLTRPHVWQGDYA